MTGSRPNTWMPIYWADYWRDTGHLSATEHGAYLNLIGCYWTTGKPLPNDNAQLARMARTTPREWRAARTAVMAFFQLDGAWHHGRIDDEIANAKANLEAKQNAGREGGKAKAKAWRNPSSASGKTLAKGLANAQQTPTPSPSPSPSPSKQVSPLAAIAASPPMKPDPKGNRLAPDWKPSAAGAEQAASLRLDYERTLADFRDYWIAKPGKDGRKLDWNRTWAKWCRRSAEDGTGSSGRGRVQRGPASTVEIGARVAARLAAREQQAEQAERVGGADNPLPDSEQEPRTGGDRQRSDGRNSSRGSGRVPERRGQNGAEKVAAEPPAGEVVADAGGDQGRMPLESGQAAGTSEKDG